MPLIEAPVLPAVLEHVIVTIPLLYVYEKFPTHTEDGLP